MGKEQQEDLAAEQEERFDHESWKAQEEFSEEENFSYKSKKCCTVKEGSSQDESGRQESYPAPENPSEEESFWEEEVWKELRQEGLLVLRAEEGDIQEFWRARC